MSTALVAEMFSRTMYFIHHFRVRDQSMKYCAFFFFNLAYHHVDHPKRPFVHWLTSPSAWSGPAAFGLSQGVRPRRILLGSRKLRSASTGPAVFKSSREDGPRGSPLGYRAAVSESLKHVGTPRIPYPGDLTRDVAVRSCTAKI